MVQLVSLAQMQDTVRRLTGRYTEAQMPTTQIDTYINLAYTLHFPEQFRNLKLTKPYVFTTIPNVDTYDFIYQAGLPSNLSTRVNIPTGSIGTTLASPWSINSLYSNYVPPINVTIPVQIIPGTVTITIQAGTPIIFNDNGLGTLTSLTAGNSGTINYTSGNVLLVHTAGTGVATTSSFSYSVTGNSQVTTTGNIVLSPPVYCQGYILRYYQDKTSFYNRWPKLTVNQIINSGTGFVGINYNGIIPSTPFLRAQLDIFGNVTEAAVIISSFDNTGFNYSISDVPVADSNTGNLVDIYGNTVGTINYLNGAYQFTPVDINGNQVVAIPEGAEIYASVIPYQSSRPTDVIFYNQQITFRPVPQQIYQVEFQISQQPTQLLAQNQAPELDEWYLFICALAAELIYNDFPDEEGMAYLKPILDGQRLIAQRRTLRQIGTQRAQTIFSNQGWRNNAGLYYGNEYSGTG